MNDPLKDTYQNQYWLELTHLMADIYYLQLMAESDQKWDGRIDKILAVSSSASIAAWAVWKQYPLLWGLIIALSQVIQAIKSYLPFKARLNALLKMTAAMQMILCDAEEKWYDVSEGRLSNEQINALRFKYIKKRKTKILNRYFNGTLPDNKRLLHKAECLRDQYLEKYYYLRRDINESH